MFFTDLKKSVRIARAFTSDIPRTTLSPTASTQKLSSTANFKLSRHDPHNLELKSTFKLEGVKVTGQFQLFLFLPSSVHLSSYTKTELKEDFHALARLAIPKSILHSENAIPREIQYFKSILEAFKTSNSAGFSIVVADHVFEATRRMGAILGEALKSQGSQIQKKLLLSFSLLNKNPDVSAELESIKASILKISAQVDELHALTSCPELQDLSVVNLLGEYINQLYVEFLVSIRTQIDPIVDDGNVAILELSGIVKGLQDKVTSSTAKRVDPALLSTQDEERENYLLKRSQLKKFFQSEMFIEVAKQEALKKYSEPVAIFGAACACLGALVVEQAGLTKWDHAGLKGASVILLGMMMYVMKDRLKDRFRNYFTDKLGKVVPDQERILTVEGNRFGVVQEWFSIKKSATLPAIVKDLRLKSCLSEAEKHIPEDILHYKKKFEIRSDLAVQFKGNQRSLQEMVRINLERYLKHMDDAYKGLLYLDAEGKFSKLRSHRIYHFHACLIASQINHTENGTQKSEEDPLFSKMYRIVMDKNGIVRVETV